MNSSFFTLFISLAILSLLSLNSTKAATCHPDDEAGLLAFKSGITQDHSGLLNSWKKDIPCCSWFGITCYIGTRVTHLSLNADPNVSPRSLSGTFSSSLAKLQHLEVIELRDLGNITGYFPRFVFQLPKLWYINIRNNRLSGPLPDNIGVLSQLGGLVLEGNQFTGPIPDSISNLTRLDTLAFNNNLLTGTIPLGIANLENLIWLQLGGNRLSGTIPNIFKNKNNLQYLDLSRNRFSGKLPPSFVSLASTLFYLELNQNNLSGTFPSYLSRFKRIEKLDLSRNRFSGVVPKSFVDLRWMKELILSHNLLTDPFPILQTPLLEVIDLSYNQFHLNKIPKWVASLPELMTLKLAKCGIKMRLDDWKLVTPFSYAHIDLSNNEISGSPVKLLNKTEYLMEFRVAGNKLRFNLGKLKFPRNLETLDLSRNLVFGKVSAEVAGLREVNLSQNYLCGKLPKTKFPASVFSGNKCLCGPPLSPCKV